MQWYTIKYSYILFLECVYNGIQSNILISCFLNVSGIITNYYRIDTNQEKAQNALDSRISSLCDIYVTDSL